MHVVPIFMIKLIILKISTLLAFILTHHTSTLRPFTQCIKKEV